MLRVHWPLKVLKDLRKHKYVAMSISLIINFQFLYCCPDYYVCDGTDIRSGYDIRFMILRFHLRFYRFYRYYNSIAGEIL